MTLYIVRRLLQSVLVIVIMLVLVFVGVYVIGNPVDVMVSTEADQEEFERMVRLLGLDLASISRSGSRSTSRTWCRAIWAAPSRSASRP